MLSAGLAVLLLLHGQAGSALAGALERAMLGMSVVVELSRPFPGTALESGANPGSASGSITRLYVPQGKRTVAQIPVRELILQAVVIDIRAKVAAQADYAVGVRDLRAWERANGRIPRRSMVLLRTGLDLDGGAAGIPAQLPGFQPAALAFLLQEREIRGVGQDTRLADAATGGAGEAARAGRAGTVQVENLTNLDRLPPKGSKLVVAPLRVTGESAPARVFAILP